MLVVCKTTGYNLALILNKIMKFNYPVNKKDRIMKDIDNYFGV